MDPTTHIVPLAAAQEILTAFGITEGSVTYHRWVRHQGFLLEDFREVLFESRFIFIIDWRAVLEEEVDLIARALSEFGVTLGYQPTDDVSGTLIAADGRRENIRYHPGQDDFGDVIESFQNLCHPLIEFRASPENDGSDSWTFSALPKQTWAQLDALAPQEIPYLFIPYKTNPVLPAVPVPSTGFFDRIFSGPRSAWIKILAAAAAGAFFSLYAAASQVKETSTMLIVTIGGAAAGALAASFLVFNDWSTSRRQRLGRPGRPLSDRLLGCIMITGIALATISLLSGFIMIVVKSWQSVRSLWSRSAQSGALFDYWYLFLIPGLISALFVLAYWLRPKLRPNHQSALDTLYLIYHFPVVFVVSVFKPRRQPLWLVLPLTLILYSLLVLVLLSFTV